MQDKDIEVVSHDDLRVVSERTPSSDELRDLLFAWNVAKFVKSNAIVYCKNNHTIGIGAGQMSRVYSAKIAGIKAADENLTVKARLWHLTRSFHLETELTQQLRRGLLQSYNQADL